MIFYSIGRLEQRCDLDFCTLYVETEVVHSGVSGRQYEAVDWKALRFVLTVTLLLRDAVSLPLKLLSWGVVRGDHPSKDVGGVKVHLPRVVVDGEAHVGSRGSVNFF